MPEPALENYRNAWQALRMIREAVETLGPPGVLPSEEAVLKLYGPEPVHEAQAIVEGQRKGRLSRPEGRKCLMKLGQSSLIQLMRQAKTENYGCASDRAGLMLRRRPQARRSDRGAR